MPASTDAAELKRAAAERAAELVRDGMTLGLGTGSTAALFIDAVGRLVAGGMKVRAVPTSVATAAQAAALGLEVVDDAPVIDLAVDGADEIDPGLSLIKGRGGALLREKVVAAAAERFVVIADETKLVARLGRGALPVEVLPFLWRRTAERVGLLAESVRLRGGEADPFRTDNGNLVLDVTFAGGIGDAAALDRELRSVPGVLETGLFVGLAGACLIGTGSGVRVLGELERARLTGSRDSAAASRPE